MKQIRIVGIYDNINYGNRLQNYAVQESLKKYDFQVKTYNIEGLRRGLKCIIHKLSGYRLTSRPGHYKYITARIKSFEKFDEKYIPTKRIRFMYQIEKDVDFFVVGSDQVWNVGFYGINPLKKRMYLLSFARPDQKVCMAPSFGVSALPPEWEKYFCGQLMMFPYLSVREKSGAKLIRRLTGREAEVVVDPTLLLDTEEWDKIAERPEWFVDSAPYILTYFLGGTTQKQNCYIQSLAAEHGMRICRLADESAPELYGVGPGEWVYLVAHAALVQTDSFHACVFSLLYGRPFQVYRRNGDTGDMFSRIENFLETFSLERKFADGSLENGLFECDYSTGKKRLAAEREKAEAFLKKSLRI